TDAMAPAGTDMRSFPLNGREILRANGRLTLADGALARADLAMTRAPPVITRGPGLAPHPAPATATSAPARVAAPADRARALAPGRQHDFVHLSDGLELRGVWQRGVRLA